jgi:hypothetical protein
METQGEVDANPRCHRRAISEAKRRAIKALVQDHGIMPKDQMAHVDANF